MSIDTSPGAVPAAKPPSRTVWLFAGVLGAASLAAGAGMMARKGLPGVVPRPSAAG